jgi:hypothetical protein
MAQPIYTRDTVIRDFFCTDGRFHKLHVGRVLRDGQEVYTTTGYHEHRSASSEATKIHKQFVRYYERNGRCWRADKDAERAEATAKRKAERKAHDLIRAAAPDLLTACKEALDSLPADAKRSLRTSLQYAIDKAEGR